MHSLRNLRRQVDDLQKRLKPVLAILRLRNLAMEYCDEFDEAESANAPGLRKTLLDISRRFMPRVGQAGFRLDTFNDLHTYFVRCINNRAGPQPKEIVFTLIPWARKGPLLRPDFWERPNVA